MSFGGAGWILAGNAPHGWRGQAKSTLITVGGILVAIAVVFFGIEHFLHPTGLPGVPLQKQMPTWIPGRVLIDYVTGAALLVAGGSILLSRKTRTVATCLGGWILLMVLVIYGPVLILALFEPGTAVKVEGINYFADTLLFAGAILALASATPRRKDGQGRERGDPALAPEVGRDREPSNGCSGLGASGNWHGNCGHATRMHAGG